MIWFTKSYFVFLSLVDLQYCCCSTWQVDLKYNIRGNFFLSPRGGHERRKILMDSHPYSYETSIFNLGAPYEEVQGRQTKLHPGFTLGKLVQPSSGISILRDSHTVLSKRQRSPLTVVRDPRKSCWIIRTFKPSGRPPKFSGLNKIVTCPKNLKNRRHLRPIIPETLYCSRPLHRT